MGKYDLLKQYFLSLDQEKVYQTFSELEKISGVQLPLSAYKYSTWWENRGHPQASAWMDAGYFSMFPNLEKQTVTFVRKPISTPEQQRSRHCFSQNDPTAQDLVSNIHISGLHNVLSIFCPDNNDEQIILMGYDFHFIQCLVPECKEGTVIEEYPQGKYANPKNLGLNTHGEGSFCRFSIIAPPVSGVYLWAIENEILYIGETQNLQKRFNSGYGNISPRNCYIGGQSTNCKMNKVVMRYYKQGTPIRLYFLKTIQYKQVEAELLKMISTKYNGRR